MINSKMDAAGMFKTSVITHETTWWYNMDDKYINHQSVCRPHPAKWSFSNTVVSVLQVIRGIAHISNKDDFFAGLVRVQKQMSKSGATVTLTERGLVEINGHLEVHPMEFSGINKVQRQVILDATKNIGTGTRTPEQFNQEVRHSKQPFLQFLYIVVKYNLLLWVKKLEFFLSIPWK